MRYSLVCHGLCQACKACKALDPEDTKILEGVKALETAHPHEASFSVQVAMDS